MFRKIEIWILYVVLLLGVLVLIGYGALIRRELLNQQDPFRHDTRFPFLTNIALFLAEIPSTLKNIQENDLTQPDRFTSISGFDGEPLGYESYLLLSRYDGDLKESVVELVDLRSFEILHTWNPDITSINKLVDSSDPVFKTFLRDRAEGRYLIHNPLLSDDGSLTFHAMSSPLIQLDYCSGLVWQNQEQRYHHSIERDHQDNLWVPTHNFPYSLDEKYVGSDVDNYLDDTITKLSPDGRVLFRKSVSEILIENDMEYLLFSIGNGFEKDPVHLNDIQPALSSGPFWEQGDLFLSLRNQSMVILYRPSSNEVIWKGVGQAFQQHDVAIVDDHQISIFNNNAKSTVTGQVVDGLNEVVIFDFQNGQYSNYLNDSIQKHEVRSTTGGIARILENGDLFLEDQNFSRTLFFSADGSLRWQHVNRASDGKVYRVSWSRLLYQPYDIAMVQNILVSEACNDE